jgi:ribosomal-protein-alanine N-acetyltransferase
MEPDPVSLRIGRHADASTLAVMSRDLIETGLGWHYRTERIRALLDEPDATTVVANAGGRTAGFAIMTLGDERAHIVLLAVRPSHQRRGIGRRLIAWLAETAATAGMACVHVELRAGNAPAHALYRAMKFSETLRVGGYYGGREAAIRMLRLLRTPGVAPTLQWPPTCDKR